MQQQLFPFSDYWWLYAIFTGAVLGLLALDLGVFHRNPHQVTFREAAAWSAVWVSLALLFNLIARPHGDQNQNGADHYHGKGFDYRSEIMKSVTRYVRHGHNDCNLYQSEEHRC